MYIRLELALLSIVLLIIKLLTSNLQTGAVKDIQYFSEVFGVRGQLMNELPILYLESHVIVSGDCSDFEVYLLLSFFYLIHRTQLWERI
jgi:hypothetical protein